MSRDHTFQRVILMWAMLFFPVALFYRIRSQLSGEKLDRRAEGWPILLTLRPLGALCAFGVVAFMINPSWMSWSSLSLQPALRWVGLAIGAIAAVLFISALQCLGKNLTDTVVTRRAHQLVTTGPYRWVRHPFYDVVLLIVLATSLLAANWFILLTGCAVFGLQVVRTAREEQQLLARFGASYRAYAQQTGRFLPNFKR
jgi:protein-S-isoprenylcysteine O-methyltransferase Ste14